MESGMPNIIDLDAERAKLTMFRRATPHSTRAERKGSVARLARLSRRAASWRSSPPGPSHWETPSHRVTSWFTFSTGSTTLEIVCDDGPPKSFALGAGMIAVIPQGAWHRFHSVRARRIWMSAVSRRAYRSRCRRPSAVPRAAERRTGKRRTPEHHRPQRRAREAHDVPADPRVDDGGSKGQRCTIGLLPRRPPSAIKFSGKDHWERHLTGDELIHVLDGSASLEIVRRRRAAPILRAPRRNDRCHSARRVAPLSLVGGF